MGLSLRTRSIRPEDVTPNPNDPADVPPATVGENVDVPGDPHGLVLEGDLGVDVPPPRIFASPWSGWPADWLTPLWNGGRSSQLADTAWMCIDLNASVLSTMPPYLVGASPSLSADWLNNPDPDLYASWEEFAKQLFWDYHLGEAFVIATAYYSTGWPARFHVVPPWSIEVEIGRDGLRHYSIGSLDVTPDVLHVRYQGSVGDARGHGPLEAGAYRMVAAETLIRYGTGLAARGGIPSSILKHPEEIDETQATELQQKWVTARLSKLGEPAVLGGGLDWEATQLNPRDMALVELLDYHERRIANLLGVPPFLVGIPAGGDSMTYSNVTSLFDFHWRAGLRPKAQAVIAGALSQWVLPRGTRVELNRDEYVQPGPLERAQTAQILNSIVDADGNPALSVGEIRRAERFDNSTPSDLSSGVLR